MSKSFITLVRKTTCSFCFSPTSSSSRTYNSPTISASNSLVTNYSHSSSPKVVIFRAEAIPQIYRYKPPILD